MGLLETEAHWSDGMLLDICLGREDMDSGSRLENIYILHSLASSQTFNYYHIIFFELLIT